MESSVKTNVNSREKPFDISVYKGVAILSLMGYFIHLVETQLWLYGSASIYIVGLILIEELDLVPWDYIVNEAHNFDSVKV